jgi:hypothetical protein
MFNTTSYDIKYVAEKKLINYFTQV